MQETTLVIGDTHIPFEHKNYLDFCLRIHKARKCSKVVHIGDLVDNHSISYHEHDPNGWSPADEMRIADKHLIRWFKAFPKLLLTRGNHDALLDRKTKTVGLPTRAFKDFRDVWNLPDKWVDDFQFTVNDVIYQHGTGYSGDLAHLNAAKNNRMNTVIGHVHHSLGVEYSANEKDCIFGCAVGCGIDRHSYAFEYGRAFKKKPILGCAVIEYTKYGSNAVVYKMEM
jgi:predicted phosphodiesterase